MKINKSQLSKIIKEEAESFFKVEKLKERKRIIESEIKYLEEIGEDLNDMTDSEEVSKPYDLYDSKFRMEFENDLMTVLNKYLGISKTNNAGTSNDNRMFIHQNIMNIINQTYPPSSLRKGSTDYEVYTNKPEKMEEFLNSIGISGMDFKTLN